MSRPNLPPQACLLDTLLASQGEEWVKLALSDNETLRAVVRFQARDCQKCREKLIGLAPDLLEEPEPLPDQATIDAMVSKLEAVLSGEEEATQQDDAWEVGGT